MTDFVIETPRLILRAWRESDAAPFHALCSDPAVMEHLDGVRTREETNDMLDRQRKQQAQYGHCFWAMERREDNALLGFCGLRVGGHPGTGVEKELEIGWRLRRQAWGRGYACEAAEASMEWGWAYTHWPRIAAWTVPANAASWGLMKRLGMTERPDLDFDHPLFAKDHPLCRHVVYTIDRPL